MMDPTPVTARIRRFIVGNGSGTAFSVSHGLGTPAPVVQVYQRQAPFFQIPPAGVQAPAPNDVVVHFATAPANGEYIVVIIG